MQLIGLEKRFENQKYLSTPDRIQLADFLGLSQLQVKTWYQNRRMKWKKKARIIFNKLTHLFGKAYFLVNVFKVLKDGSKNAPTKPKGRPKKNSIPSFSDILKEAAIKNGDVDSMAESISSDLKNLNSSVDESDSSCMNNSDGDEEDDEIELSDDDENEDLYAQANENDTDDEEENELDDEHHNEAELVQQASLNKFKKNLIRT